MKPKNAFDYAISRAKHSLQLYELLHNTRQRQIRSDWARKFKELMHWPIKNKIERIDGNKSLSILLLREEAGINRKHFTDEYLSELLRSSLVNCVAALDRYFHDIVLLHCLNAASKPEVKKELRELYVPLCDVVNAIKTIRNNKTARPGNAIKKVIQDILHKDYTFQGPDAIVKASKMLGIDDFWGKVSDAMSLNKDMLIKKHREIINRRNQIVHEADIERKIKAKILTKRPINKKYAEEACALIEKLVEEANKIFESKY